MKTKKIPYNVQLFAVNTDYGPGFNIYISVAGQRELLYYHRHNGLLYKLLEKGVYLDTLYRWKPNKLGYHAGKKLEHNIKYLLKVVDVYLEEYYQDVA